jgi:hypothetical protein
MKSENDQGGQRVYLTSCIKQDSLNTAVNFAYQVINEELCKLSETSGTIDPSKIFVGGVSQGSLVTAATFMR